MTDNRPKESILGTIIGLAEIGFQCYMFMTKDKRSGIMISEEQAKKVIPSDLIENADKVRDESENEVLVFEKESADKVKEVLLEKEYITDESFIELCYDKPNLFEVLSESDSYFPNYDDDLSEDYDLEP